jgi:hypothetical protein
LGDTERVIARWRRSVASGEALVILHQEMCFISHRHTAMAINLCSKTEGQPMPSVHIVPSQWGQLWETTSVFSTPRECSSQHIIWSHATNSWSNTLKAVSVPKIHDRNNTYVIRRCDSTRLTLSLCGRGAYAQVHQLFS